MAGRAGSEQSADALPSASRHLSVLSQSWGRIQAGQDRCAKGLGRQVALSGLGGCLEGERQTDSVTLKSPQAWLGATKSQTPPHSNPPSWPP